MLSYPARILLRSKGLVILTIPDVPGAVIFGSDEIDALQRAPGVLDGILREFALRKRRIPVPSRASGGLTVSPPRAGFD
jgi:hypothetical protein